MTHARSEPCGQEVDGATIDLAEIKSLLDGLALPAGDWAVHASAVMVAHGLLPEANDVDVVARGAAWARALTLGKPVSGVNDLAVRLPGGVEIWSGWLGEEIDALIDGAELVAGLPCVTPAEVLRFKEGLRRPKDLPHIELLRLHLGRGG